MVTAPFVAVMQDMSKVLNRALQVQISRGIKMQSLTTTSLFIRVMQGLCSDLNVYTAFIEHKQSFFNLIPFNAILTSGSPRWYLLFFGEQYAGRTWILTCIIDSGISATGVIKSGRAWIISSNDPLEQGFLTYKRLTRLGES